MSGIPGSIRRITPDGIITKYVGGSVKADDVPAINASVSPWGIDVGPDGSLYLTHGGGDGIGSRFRRVTPDGIIHHLKGVVGTEIGANMALSPVDIVVGRDGVAYGKSNNTIYALWDDTASIYAGGSGGPVQRDLELDGWPAIGTYLDGYQRCIAAAPNGDLYVRSDTRILRVASAYPNLGAAAYYVPELARNQLYLFDFQGRHLRTLNSVTGADVFVFDYDAQGYLSSIIDAAGRETNIVRDTAGRATAIVGPYGQTTTLTDYDANGFVGAVTDPVGQSVHVQYGTAMEDLGLVTQFTDWRGFSSLVTYDNLGRVTKDQDALGGFKALTLGPKGPQSSEVTLSTALGVTTTYHFERMLDGTKTDTTTHPDGTESVTTLSPDQVTTAALPDGTTITVKRDADPIWGMRSPMTTTTTTLPSGLSRVESSSRTATRSATDPALLTSEQVTETLNGRSTRTTFAPATRTYTRVSPVGRTSTRVIDALGRTTSITRPGAAQVLFDYDPDGRLMATTQGSRVTVQSYYDTSEATNGYLESVTDPLSQTTTFVPDALGRTLSQTLGSATTSFSWDGEGNMTSVTPPGKPVHGQTFTAVNVLEDYVPPAAGLSVFATHNDYDLDHRLTRTTRPDAVVVDRSYDGAGRLDLLTMPSGSIDYEHYPAECDISAGCAPGKLASISSPSGVNLGYTYDGMLQVSETWSGAVAGSVTKTHDNNFRTVGETIAAAGSTVSSAFSYDNDGLMTCASPTTCPSGAGAVAIARSASTGFVTGTTLGSVNDAYTHNSYGELATYTARHGTTTLYSVTYDSASAPRDKLGRVVQKTETVEGTTRVLGYSYDVQGRLTDVTENGSSLEHYEYDLNGNRTHAVVAGQESDGVYDEQDRLLSYGAYTYTYTANGELLTKTGPEGTTTYAYDAQGSLVAVDLPDGRLVEYVTDGMGRRVAKKVDGVVVRQWLYRDRLAPIAELDGSGSLVAQYVFGTKPNAPDLVIRGGQTYRVVSDQLGSPMLAINVADSADAPFRAEYSAFGQVTGDGLEWMAFGFAGGMYDADTGLVRFGARDYEASTGRWVSKDPILFRGGSRLLYSYAANDPTNKTDAYGLFVYECTRWGTGSTSFVRHRYNCVYEPGGDVRCYGWGGEEPHDVLNSSDCHIVDSGECMDSCMLWQFGDSLNKQTPYNPFWNNCWQWSDRALQECRDACSG